MEVIIGMIAVATGLICLYRYTRLSSHKALVRAGAIRRSLSSELESQPFLGLAAITPAQYDNLVRASLTSDGIVLSFKGNAEEYFLPLDLISVTGESWLHNPLTFGQGQYQIELNLGEAITQGVTRMKKDKDIQQSGSAYVAQGAPSADPRHRGRSS